MWSTGQNGRPSKEEARMSTDTGETQKPKSESDGSEAAAGQPAPRVPHQTPAERAALGKAVRAQAPRASHSTLETSGDRDAVEIVDADTPSRVPELVPIRYGRMLVSPFTFYRGAASLMAHDLASMPRTGLRAQLCGDAHLSNFGGFASPSRELVFDLNDFDETLPGPFEWDVKRLAASFEIAGRDRGFDGRIRRDAVLTAVRAYRESMNAFAAMNNLAVWYSRLNVSEMLASFRKQNDKKQAKAVKRGVAKARTTDSMQEFDKLTHEVDRQTRIISDTPMIVPIAELAEAAGFDADEVVAGILELYRGYRRTLQHDRKKVLESFRYVDLARKVVGVGSVGTRCWILLLLGRDDRDPLFLQVKETGPSVLEPWLGRSQFRQHGQRVVEGQRLMQAASDIFLGWIRNKETLDGAPSRDFYVRQLWDWKTSVDLDTIEPRGFDLYAQACGSTLARAHARSGDRIAIATYLGKSDVFDRALADFAVAYADQNEQDYETLVQAVRDGRIEAKEGL